MTAERTALALTGGGARGAYQAGVLAGIADRCGCDFCFPVITGVSAGGINAAALAAHPGTFPEAAAHLREAWCRLSVDQVFRSNFASLTWSFVCWAVEIGSGGRAPFELRGLVDTQPLRHFLESAIETLKIDPSVETEQIESLERVQKARDAAAVSAALEALRRSAADGHNVMPALIHAAKVYCTVGETMGALVDVYGRFDGGVGW